MLKIEDEKSGAVILLVFSFLSYILAEYLIKQYFFYRQGIEEALLLGSMGLFTAGTSIFINDLHLGNSTEIVIVCIILSLYSGWLHFRFGFLYSLLIASAALIVIPFLVNLSPVMERTTALLLMSLFLFSNIYMEKPDDFDFQKKNNGIFQVCLFLGIYLVCNLRLTDQNLYYSDK